jgi:hypothetical protein
VDLGIVNIAATSDGERHCGHRINRKRKNDRKLRRKLQQKQTKSAKRRARKYARKEARRNKDINHKISKRIVAEAGGTSHALKAVGEQRSRNRPGRPEGHSRAAPAEKAPTHHAPLLDLRATRRLHRLQGEEGRGAGGVCRSGVHQPGMLPMPSHRTRQPALTSPVRLPVLRIR